MNSLRLLRSCRIATSSYKRSAEAHHLLYLTHSLCQSVPAQTGQPTDSTASSVQSRHNRYICIAHAAVDNADRERRSFVPKTKKPRKTLGFYGVFR
jgi:hypothetical protein